MAAKTQNKAHKNGSDKKNKNKKKSKKTGPAAVAMKQKATVADNPFETIWSSRKFDVLGKKRKGEERRVGFSRSKGIEKRKNTLLKDYQRSAKSSVFVDNRIGEGNAELGEFDKAVMRSQKEHKVSFLCFMIVDFFMLCCENLDWCCLRICLFDWYFCFR
ncbi:Nucleolar protein 14 [Linum perenne]